MRSFIAALAVVSATSAPVLADDFAISDRDTFRDEVRAYLLDNPEVLLEAMRVLEERRAQDAALQDSDMLSAYADELFNDPTSWAGGNLDGDVTLVEFVDYRCGYCKRAHPEISELVENDGNIRIVRKEFPILGEDSLKAARYALAVRQVAGDDAYEGVSDALMTMRSAVTDDVLSQMAESFGLDWAEIQTAMDSDEVAAVIAKNHDLGRRMQINGTPAFVMENQMLRGYLPPDAMRQVLAEVRESK